MNTEPRPGSRKRIKGYVQISPLAALSFQQFVFSEHIEPYRFHINKDNVYYINGRKQIFRLDITSNGIVNIHLDPIYEILWAYGIKGPVMFTPISHVEYIFS